MSDILFQIIIQPIRLVIEIAYMMFDWVFKGNVGVSLVGVSVTVSLLCLPLYAKAEKLQEKERDIQKKLSKRVSSIKSHFSGDEQYMILSTYYRQNHYHPLYSLRSSVSLLIQVPFFIAAYSFLSHLEALKGQAFLCFSDLGSPDGLLKIGALSINVLPILMTAINIVSGAIYTKGFPLKDKVQLYLMAIVFLFLLYTSPSALVLYWTFNNVFSLVKNLVFKMRNPLKFLYLSMCALLAVACFYIIFIRHHSRSYRLRNISLTVLVTAFLVCVPLYIRLARFAARTLFGNLFAKDRRPLMIFLSSVAGLWILFGVFIPFNLVASSPFEFSGLGQSASPFSLLMYPAAQCAGLFLFWLLYVYLIFPPSVKGLLTLASSLLFIFSVIGVFLYQGDYGTVSRTLQFNNGGLFSIDAAQLVALAATLAATLALVFFFIKTNRLRVISTVCILLCLSLGALSLYKGSLIASGYERYRKIAAEEKVTEAAVTGKSITPVFNLSKTGKNVFIIMLDKAIGSYFPLLLEQRPELAGSYSGFVYYPNVLSFSYKTILGAPPLFGGYEYTPVGMNTRSETKMIDKHNESLLVMPLIFKENGYRPIFTNAPFVNYDWVADSAFFRERGIDACNLKGMLTERYQKEQLTGLKSYTVEKLLERNFVLFSFMSALSAPLKQAVYNNGQYWNSCLLTINTLCLDSYAVLNYLDELTDTSSSENTFSILVNDLTHEPCLLQYPDYTFVSNVTDQGPDIVGNKGNMDIWGSNAASFIMIGKWLEYLREKGVYDNTRIIIVSDHGNVSENPHLDDFQKGYMMPYNPILMVKDFGETSPLRTDGSFMTNADVPLLATDNIIKDPVNPFTRNKLTACKNDGIYIVREETIHQGYQIDLRTVTTCYDEGAGAWHVSKDIFDRNNWVDERMKK